MKKLIIISLLLLSISCGVNPKSIDDNMSNNITYFKDDKTGLCFAQMGSATKDYYIVISFTEVQCDKVSNFLIKRK